MLRVTSGNAAWRLSSVLKLRCMVVGPSLEINPLCLNKASNYAFCLHSTFQSLGGILFSFPFCSSASCLSVKFPDAPPVRAALLLGAANTAQLNLHFTTESAASSVSMGVCLRAFGCITHTHFWYTCALCVAYRLLRSQGFGEGTWQHPPAREQSVASHWECCWHLSAHFLVVCYTWFIEKYYFWCSRKLKWFLWDMCIRTCSCKRWWGCFQSSVYQAGS